MDGLDALPVVEYVFALQGGAGNPSPVLRIDSSQRPDAADAIRRICAQLDGPDGAIASSWQIALCRDTVLVILNARVVRPFECSLRLAFDIQKHADVLWSIVTSGSLGLTAEHVVSDLDDVIHSDVLWFRPAPGLARICAAASAYATLLARPDGTAVQSDVPQVFLRAFAN